MPRLLEKIDDYNAILADENLVFDILRRRLHRTERKIRDRPVDWVNIVSAQRMNTLMVRLLPEHDVTASPFHITVTSSGYQSIPSVNRVAVYGALKVAKQNWKMTLSNTCFVASSKDDFGIHRWMTGTGLQVKACTRFLKQE